MIHYDPEKPLLLAYDALPYGLEAVLWHQMPDRSEKPITFASRTLTKRQHTYSQIEKEALAIVYAVKKFHQYLFGRHFFLYTDHKPLLGLLSELKGIPSMAAARIQCWPILLSAYNCTLKYHSGIENSNVDFFNDAIPMTNITSAVIDCLRSTFSIHRILYFIVSDNGPSLTSEEFKKFCKLNGMKYLTIAPYHPSSNGAAERSVQTFKTSLKKIIEGKPLKDLNAILQSFLLTYCTTPHCTTRTYPAELLFRRKLNTHLSFINPTLLNTINSHHYSKGLR